MEECLIKKVAPVFVRIKILLAYPVKLSILILALVFVIMHKLDVDPEGLSIREIATVNVTLLQQIVQKEEYLITMFVTVFA